MKEQREFAIEEKIAYGEDCIRIGLALATQYLPSKKIISAFVGETHLESLQNLAQEIAKILPFSMWGKPISKEYPIHDLRTLLSVAPDFERIDCRVVAFETALVLDRDQLVEQVWLANIAYEKPSIHAQVVAQKDNNLYGVQYGSNSYSHAFQFAQTRYQYNRYALTGLDIFQFEHEVKTI